MIKNITLSADENLIQKARRKAQQEHKTLNAIFRDWLRRYTHQDAQATNYSQFMKKLHHVEAGGTFTREQMNER